MKNIYALCISWAAILPLVLSAGCSVIPQAGAKKELIPINTIGVMPAQPAMITVPPSDTKTMAQLETGAQVINSLLNDYFRDLQHVHFISETEIEGLQTSQAFQPLALARAAGLQLHYDAVLVTDVIRYETRSGSPYAVDKPASVAFSLKLLAVSSGQIVCSADFDQTQQPLFENILKSRTTGSGFRWLTAAELAEAGLRKKLDSCPYLQ